MVITKRGLVLGATALASMAAVVTGAGIHLSQGQAFFKESPKELVDEVWQLIDREYVDGSFNETDWIEVRSEYLGRSYESQEDAYEAIREMLEQLEDPYTRFMDPQEFRNMQIDTSGELTGVGIQISQDEETEEIVVVAPIEQTPAFEAGVRPGDVITAIDGQSTEGMDLNQAVSLIRGPVNSQVTLTLRREDESIDFELTRAQIEIHPVRYSVKDGPEGTVGYIRLNQFSANAADEMREAIQALEERDVTGYVLDLRSNPGGLLYASIDIAEMWLESGTIVSTVDREGITDEEVAHNRALTDKPLVILVDGGSASASEILSGALQDNHRASLVGTKTFGKGLVQSVRGLADGSGVAVTIAKYLTPSGRDINKLGIEPDVVLELSDEQRDVLGEDLEKIGTAEDPQYVEALDVLGDVIRSGRQSISSAPEN
ncbi:PDZ domain-containing protein [Romeria aff. gracilis LEGE 07310]|uniref:Carboxyl-terminal-processing protease n=1 Tax=Vasconcelosia minhoensis LEGE 07310 TaxID=915328 RepID=A0A8J7AGC7_9CYAN|nr:carboxyl-terminal processing protease CtpC [Romeria gracilis]MBE9077038.1 PDZ domain-containing protein [Romeria aff. gracilis LEGE 07310]